ncbi:cyanophycinase [Roseateles sp. BYS87W]|uniref:Cyanophycinase n=1 Tax=Pelomonas baiyunensis TaxID=3299026 RepID=A0ABW7GW01_9BURK
MPNGKVVVVGGALQPGSDAVWQRIVDEAGGAGVPIAVFPTAAYEPERISAQIVAALSRCGARPDVVPLAPHLDGVDVQASLNDPALIARVAGSRAVFFSGGAQEYIVDTLQPGGASTAMLDAVRAVHAAGGVVAGTSAGAAVMSEWMFRDAMDTLAVLRGRWRAGQEYDRGLGLLPAGVLVDQHFLKRGRIGRLLPALQALGCRWGVGVDENAAVVWDGMAFEVIGGSGAVLVDLAEAQRDPALPAFNLRGVRLTYLGAGDRHDLSTGITTPAAHKRQRRERAPGRRMPVPEGRYFMDILADGGLLAALTQLLDAGAGEVRGLAYQAPADLREPQAEVGFEFRLTRGEALRAWMTPGQGLHEGTLCDARLDVVPVRVAHPLFTPLGA